MPLPIVTQTEPVRRAHCQYCGGKGADLQTELVVSPIGTRYRIPLSHATCKHSVLSLSLSLCRPSAAACLKEKGSESAKE